MVSAAATGGEWYGFAAAAAVLLALLALLFRR